MIITSLYVDKKINYLKRRKQLRDIRPVILDGDYTIGFKERYFCKHFITGKVYELDEAFYNGIISKDIEYPYELCKATSIKWKLTGPYKDTKINNKMIFGVYDTNLRSMHKAMQIIPEIGNKLWNLTEYARITMNNIPKLERPIQTRKD